jgi:hypothetical protein
MVIWGTISALTAACQSYGGLIACRFMLGFIEAAYFVGPIHLFLNAERLFFDSQVVCII